MPFFLKLYLVLALVSIVVRAVGSAMKHDKLDIAGVFIGLAAGVILAIGFAMLDDSRVSGAYVYKVNGVRVGSGIVTFVQSFAIGIMGGAVPSLIGMGIGDGIRAAAQRKAAGDKSISLLGKIGCVFFLVEGGFGLIGGLIRFFVDMEDSELAIPFLIVGLVFLAPGLLLLRKWRRK